MINGIDKIPFPELLPKPTPMSDSAMAHLMLYQVLQNDLDKWVNDNVGISADRMCKPAQPNTNYMMGVDTYDENFGAVCVISKNTISGNLVCEYSSRVHKEDFEEEVKRVSQYYNIPQEKILKEKE